MSNYNFVCPECGGDSGISEVVTGAKTITSVGVDDFGSGPEFWANETETVDDVGSYVEYQCADCGWTLPCRDPDELVDYIVTLNDEEEEVE